MHCTGMNPEQKGPGMLSNQLIMAVVVTYEHHSLHHMLL